MESAGDNGLSRGAQMSLRQQVTKECWEAESPEERKQVHDLANADLKRRKDEFAAGTKPPETPEEYDQ